MLVGSIIKQPVFAIIVPVQIAGENRYALARSPSQHALPGLDAANQLPPSWQAIVSDASLHIVARSDHQDVFIGQELPPAQWRHAGPGVFEFIDPEGRASPDWWDGWRHRSSPDPSACRKPRPRAIRAGMSPGSWSRLDGRIDWTWRPRSGPQDELRDAPRKPRHFSTPPWSVSQTP
jgi:hypothetical protein